MSRPTLYVAITAHGFGHAVRSASVVAAIIKLNPDILPILVTAAPRWLLDSYIEGEYIQRPRGYDVGVIQSDSLSMDKTATREKLAVIKKRQNSIIAGEVNFIKTNRVSLILADIPPLAASIASHADLPCWMMGNFGWDFIYKPWGEDFADLVDWITEDYQKCDRLFKLPLSESMSAFPNVIETGLTGGSPRYDKREIADKFQICAPQERTVLLSFGGLGLQSIPYHNLEKFPDWQFITFEREAPDLPNLIRLQGDNTYRPVDFMPLCGRVISKPGYSTFAEALRLDVPIVSLTRQDFAESAILLQGISDYSHHQIIEPEEFFQGNWDFLNRPLQSPRTSLTLPKDGTETIARQVVDYLS